MTSTSNDASSSDRSKRRAERSVQPGSIDRNSIQGTGFELPGDALGLRNCFICYDDDGQRICNRIPCPPSDDDMVVSSASGPSPADAAGIAAASQRKPNGFAASAERSVQSGGIARDPVIEQPRGGSGFEGPQDVEGLAEKCYMCHEHPTGGTVCHEIVCP